MPRTWVSAPRPSTACRSCTRPTSIWRAPACTASTMRWSRSSARSLLASTRTCAATTRPPRLPTKCARSLPRGVFVWVDGVAPRIASYSGRGALGAWVRVAAVRVGLRLTEQRRAPMPTIESALSTDPELDYVRSRYKSSFSQALTEGLATLSPEERNLLRLHFVDGLTIDGLAPFFGVHRATAARRLADARQATPRRHTHAHRGASRRDRPRARQPAGAGTQPYRHQLEPTLSRLSASR